MLNDNSLYQKIHHFVHLHHLGMTFNDFPKCVIFSRAALQAISLYQNEQNDVNDTLLQRVRLQKSPTLSRAVLQAVLVIARCLHHQNDMFIKGGNL
jgi:hypothetical protein